MFNQYSLCFPPHLLPGLVIPPASFTLKWLLKWNIAVLLEQSAPCWPSLPSKRSAIPCTNTPLQVCIAGSALVAKVWQWGWAGWASAPRAPIMHWWIDCCTAASVSVPWAKTPRLREGIPAMAPAVVLLLCTTCRGHRGLAAWRELPWPTYCCHTPGDTLWGQAGRCVCVCLCVCVG